jgi:Kef-type K+ transport system membrane component KefB
MSELIDLTQWNQGATETFIIGAALSVTSLGTTFVVIGSASSEINFASTKVGTVLVSSAVFDDVSGLVMASVIDSLGEIGGDGGVNLGWLIGRPNVASAAMAILTPVLGKYVFAPLFRYWLEDHWPRYRHSANIVLMIFVLSAFLTIAAYAGTSVLYGSFLAGTFISYLPDKHPDGPFVVPSREEGERMEAKCPTFLHTFEKYILDVQHYLMQPLFFASIGFAIPFKSLWSGTAIWRGIVYTILMFIGKVRNDAKTYLCNANCYP